MKEKIGLDFDGVLTIFPPIIGFLARQLNSEQYPKFLTHFYFRYIVRRLPIKLNRKRLKVLGKEKKHFDFYVISGRIDEWRVKDNLKGYEDIFKGIYARGWPSKLKEWQFKEKKAKELKIDFFLDDCLHTVLYLQKKGIKALKV